MWRSSRLSKDPRLKFQNKHKLSFCANFKKQTTNVNITQKERLKYREPKKDFDQK